MVEYIHDIIICDGGVDNNIHAIITDDEENFITQDCAFMLHDKDGALLSMIDGVCTDNTWTFTIPAKETDGLKGRYWYCIKNAGGTLCFMKPFYIH